MTSVPVSKRRTSKMRVKAGNFLGGGTTEGIRVLIDSEFATTEVGSLILSDIAYCVVPQVIFGVELSSCIVVVHFSSRSEV